MWNFFTSLEGTFVGLVDGGEGALVGENDGSGGEKKQNEPSPINTMKWEVRSGC